MREYKIWHYPRENERIIYRTDGDTAQYFTSQKLWASDKKQAKRFLHQQEAVSALVIIKRSWDLKTEEEYIEEKLNESKEKTTRKEM